MRLWSIQLGIAVILVGSLVTIGRSQPEGSTEPLGPAWSRKVPGVVALAVSPDGSRLLAAEERGSIRCYNERGDLLWNEPYAGVDRLVTSRGGELTLAYSTRQPLLRQVHFIGPDGKRLLAVEPSEPVQSAIVSPEGRYAAIAAGKSLIFCSRGPRGNRRRVISLPGHPRQIQFGPADTVYVACREPDAVLLVKSTGKVLWREQERAAKNYTISASEDGRRLVIGSQKPEDVLEVSLVNEAAEPEWTITRPGRAPRVRLSAGGGGAILAYEHKVEHGDERRYERRLAYLDGNSTPAWTKGGAYTAPYYVSVDQAGEWCVALDSQSGSPRFLLLGRNGGRRWSYPCPTDVLIATSSTRGRHIAVYRADGLVEMIRVSTP